MQPDLTNTMIAAPDPTTTMNSGGKRKRRGRPRGKKNEPQPTAHQVLARCPRCGCTGHEVVKRIGEQHYAGVSRTGECFTSIVRRRVRCRSCDQMFIRIERPFDPAKWRR